MEMYENLLNYYGNYSDSALQSFLMAAYSRN